MSAHIPLPTTDEVREAIIDLIPGWDRPMDRIDVAVQLLVPLGLPDMKPRFVTRVGATLRALQVSGELRQISQGWGGAWWGGKAASPCFTPAGLKEPRS